jgi:hypothetical protein
MKFDVLNRWTGKVQFTAEIECDADASTGVKIGLAVRWACKSGAVLSDANLIDAYLRGAVLSGANLRDAVLSGAVLRGADLRDADLSGAVLSGADLRDAILSGAYLRGAILSGAYLRGADISDAPKIPDIHKVVYAAASAPDALDMADWHSSCGTSHCRAGWVTTLAGPEGKALENRIGTPAAAALIYLASDPTLERVPDFYCDNEAALADMKRLAEREG